MYKLKPYLAHRLWGSDKLAKIYDKSLDDTIGEAWVMSCISGSDSYVDEHTTLLEIFNKDKNIVAKGWNKDFPILIKLIDAKQDLSIQVHPDVKTEFWHILNSKPSNLYIGFKDNTSKQEITNVLNNGDITKYLNNVQVSNGDSFLITPGTVHAIRAGTFLIEIQQSADCTYRIYDYHRKDFNGKERELHIDQALACINYDKYHFANQSNKNNLVKCKFFNVDKYVIDGNKEFIADDKSFNSIVVVEGNGKIESSVNSYDLKQYDSIFIPAGEGKYKISGNLTIILTSLN